MADMPTKCLFCGTSCSAEIRGILTFRCGSKYFPMRKQWVQRYGCEVNVLRERIGRAGEKLESIDQKSANIDAINSAIQFLKGL